jgi:hypothetical protein
MTRATVSSTLLTYSFVSGVRRHAVLGEAIAFPLIASQVHWFLVSDQFA